MPKTKIEVKDVDALEDMALDFINTVDYDIYKECLNNRDEFGYDSLIDSVVDLLIFYGVSPK